MKNSIFNKHLLAYFLIIIITIFILTSCGEKERNPFVDGGGDNNSTTEDIEFVDDVLVWNSGDLACRIRVEYGATWGNWTHFAYSTDDSYTDEHSVKLLGAEAGTRYYFRICAQDNGGHVSFYTDSDSVFVLSNSTIDKNHLFKFVMLDVERNECIGDGLFMHLPTGENFLIDSGMRSKSGYIHDFLVNENATTIDYAWFTHCHADHYGGFEGSGHNGLWYMNDLHFVNFYYPASSTSSYHDTYNRLKSEASSQCDNAAALTEGTEWNFGSVNIKILHSGAMDGEENNCSIAAYISYGNLHIITAGDSQHAAEYNLMNKYPDLIEKVTVYKVDHHGHANANAEDYIAAMNPRICMIPADEQSSDPEYSQPLPYPSVVSLLENYNIDIFRVDKTDPYSDTYQYGDIKLISDGDYYEIYY